MSDENDAYLLLEELRWHGTPICAHCGHDKANRSNSERLASEVVVTKHKPTPEERDERVKVDLTPEELIEGVLQAGPHPDEDDDES